MPQKTRRTKRTSIKTEEKNIINATSQISSIKKKLSRKHLIIIAILLIALLVWKFKSMLIVATVNGQLISRWQLDQELAKKFGEQVLENIINERLILAATRNKGIFVENKDIDDKIQEIKKKIEGNIDFNQALKAQGLTQEDFRKQIEIQVSIDKLFQQETSISAQEIEDYIAKNKTLLQTATDPAILREDVKNMLKQQKVAELFDKWFSDIRQKADIKKFL